mgnify:CR=1 FL=1
MLQAEIIKTDALVKSYQELTKPVAPDVAIGRISRMDHINNKSITESALRQAEQKLKSLHVAIDKVGTPEFGICARCKSTIPLGRILIKPESPFCVRCAS